MELRPIVAVLKLVQIRRAKCNNEILDEFVLRLLLQRHAEQFKFHWRLSLTNIVGKTKVAGETNIKVLYRKLVKLAVVQTLHPQCDDRFYFVAFRAQRGDEFSRKVLVQQNFHARCNSF